MARPHPGVRPHPGLAWGHGPTMNGGLLGGAGPPPQSTMQPSGFLEVDRRLRTLANYYRSLGETEIVREIARVIFGINNRVEQLFILFGGQAGQLRLRLPDWTLANDAYAIVRKTASQADRGSDVLLANALRESLLAINKHADDAWKAVAGGVRHRRRPNRRENWDTAGDDRTACDSPGHPAADAHSHGIRLGLRLQAVARPVQRLQEL